MRIIFLLLITVSAYHSQAQVFSGQSSPTNFLIPIGTSRFSANSNPTILSVRQQQSFSNTSSPVTFNVGKTKSLNSKNAAERTKTELINEKSIPELETNYPKYYSLIIGINDYQFNSTRLLDLSKAIDDAVKLQQTLLQNFNFQPENSKILLNPSRKEIIKEFETLSNKVTTKDNLLIFYAGHGVWDERLKVGYWLPNDAKTDDKSTWISNSTIRDYVAGINSKHTLLITDACFSGSIFRTRDMDLTDYAMSNLYRLPSRKAMTSGTLTTVPDESKFMQYFLKRLTDTEGKYISARQVFYGLETAVLNNSNTVPQFGVIQDTGDEGGDFIFIRRQKN